jgi:hypothetical protein
MKLSLNHVKYQKGLILERIEKNDGVVKKTLQDLGGIIDGSFTFGTGITAMLPAVKQLMAGIDPTLTEQDIILLYITAMWILVGKHQDKIEKLIKLIREKGLSSSLSTVLDFLKSVENIAIKIGESIGYTANSLVDIVAFTFLAFPILDGLLFLINQGLINPGSPTGYLKSILFGVGLIGSKNIFNHIIKKLGGKLKDMEDSSENLNEQTEFFDETVMMVDDVMRIVHSSVNDEKTKTYYLPEDLNSEEITYDVDDFVFTLELTIGRDENLDDEFNIEAYYLDGEDTIEIGLMINPLMEPDSYEHIENYLTEYIRHEIRHAEQELLGTKPENIDRTLSGLSYYTQPHEIDAQTSGLNLRRLKQNRSFEDTVRNSIENTKKRYGLTDEEGEELYNILLKDILEKYGKENLKEEKNTEGGIRKKVLVDNDSYQIYVILSYKDICNVPKTKYCSNNNIKRMVNGGKFRGTPYVVDFKKSNKDFLIIDDGKIPLLREEGSNKNAYDWEGGFESIHEIFSNYESLQDFFKLKYTLEQRIKYNMEFSEKLLNDIKDTNNVTKALYNFILDEDNEENYEELKKYFGDFDEYTGGYYSKKPDTMDIDIGGDEVTIYLDKDDWINNVLCVSDEDKYYYDLYENGVGYWGHEELDYGELDYVACYFSTEVYNQVIDFMRFIEPYNQDLNDTPECHRLSDGFIKDFFEKYFPSKWRYTSDEIMSALSDGVGESRLNELKKFIDDKIYLDYGYENNDLVYINLTTKNLLYLLSHHNVETISDLFDGANLCLLGDVYLYEVYNDSWDFSDEWQEMIDNAMSDLLNDIKSSSDWKEDVEFVKKVNKFILDNGFTKRNSWSPIYELNQILPDGSSRKISYYGVDLDDGNKVIFQLNNTFKKLKYDFEDFVNLVTTQPLFDVD